MDSTGPVKDVVDGDLNAFFSVLLQFLSDPYPPVEREHRDGTAGSASGCEECRSGGEYTSSLS